MTFFIGRLESWLADFLVAPASIVSPSGIVGFFQIWSFQLLASSDEAVSGDLSCYKSIVGGVTLHSFSGIGLGKEPAEDVIKRIRKNGVCAARKSSRLSSQVLRRNYTHISGTERCLCVKSRRE